MEQQEINDLIKLPQMGKHGNHSRQNCQTCIAQHTLAVEFGRRRGWLLAQRGFGIKTLAARKVWTTVSEGFGYFRDHEYAIDGTEAGDYYRCIDHSYCYRDKNRRAIAMAVHLYDLEKKKIEKFAAKYNLVAEFPEDFPSWWYPGHTHLIVFRRPFES